MAKVAVITGAGRGIGRALAHSLAGAGFHVVLAARSQAELEAVAAAIQAAGGTTSVVTGDLGVEEEVRQLIATAAAVTGHLDVVIANAGQAQVGPFWEQSLEAWQATLNVSLTGAFLLCKHAVLHLVSGSHLFTIGSIASRTAFPGWAAYSAAKWGLLGFTNAMREELRERGIKVTAVLPGAVDTALWDAIPGDWNHANMLQPGDVARAVLHAVNEPPHVSIDEIVLSHQVGKL